MLIKCKHKGAKAEPVASDRLLRKLAFILCSAWLILSKSMNHFQKFITKFCMESLFVSDTKEGQENESGSGQIGMPHTRAVGRISQI